LRAWEFSPLFNCMDEARAGANATGEWLKNNLVTLGSAAILSVYSAGYFHTREAADRFASESVRRRPASPATPAPNPLAASPRNHIEERDAQKLAVIKPSSSQSAAGATARTAAAAAPSTASSTPSSPATPTLPSAAAPAISADDRAAATPVTTTSATPAPAAAAPVDAAPLSSPAPATTTVTAAAPAAPAAPTPTAAKGIDIAALKNGVYYGWGQSRHGDIEAAVEIQDGRITGAWITKCQTAYPCGWISALPPQVIARQSPETDYISGATQSTDAFYQAVVRALDKAK
jgi:uncharacterized protein with FMN-binding domain